VSAVCAALAFLFAFVVLGQPTEIRVEPAPAAWNSR
jgi:hypothetical protein